jgi:hypothetical protein
MDEHRGRKQALSLKIPTSGFDCYCDLSTTNGIASKGTS